MVTQPHCYNQRHVQVINERSARSLIVTTHLMPPPPLTPPTHTHTQVINERSARTRALIAVTTESNMRKWPDGDEVRALLDVNNKMYVPRHEPCLGLFFFGLFLVLRRSLFRGLCII